jgi:uncharacterized damage-inducible protein DinB
VPTSGWHIDANYLSALAPPAGVRTHALFGDVGPRGGGTQLVSGSHRLVHKWFTDHPPPRGTRGEEWRRRYAGDVRGQQMGPHPRWRMTVEDLRMLVDYHYWARDRMFEALAPLTAEQFTRHVANSFPSIRETVVHLYTADWGWHLLWQGLPLTQPPSVDSFPDLASVQTVWQDEERKVRGFVENLREADVGGFWPKFLHVVNHASYHRGQVTMMLRQLGVEVPRSQDMIIFSKERSAMESLQAIASAR